MADKAQPKVKVGTPKTEAIVGSAAVHMGNAVKSFKELYSKGDDFIKLIDDYTVKATDLEQRIEGLAVTFEQKKAEQQFKLDMDYKTNKAAFANEYLEANDLLAVAKTDYGKLKGSYEGLKNDFEKKLTEKTTEVENRFKTEYQNKEALLNANLKVTESANIAKIAQLEAQLASANESANNWKQQLDAERAAGVQRAQASAIQNVNIPSGK